MTPRREVRRNENRYVGLKDSRYEWFRFDFVFSTTSSAITLLYT